MQINNVTSSSSQKTYTYSCNSYISEERSTGARERASCLFRYPFFAFIFKQYDTETTLKFKKKIITLMYHYLHGYSYLSIKCAE